MLDLYDVTILHRRTHFRCPNIVLKFLVILLAVHNGPWQFWGHACAVSRDP